MNKYQRYNKSEKGRAREARRRAKITLSGEKFERDQERIVSGRKAADVARYRERQRTYALELHAESSTKRHYLDDEVIGKVVILSDLQIPYEDPAAVQEALRIIDYVQPDTVVLNGDIVDCYAESAFLKDPKKASASIPETHRRTQALLDALQPGPGIIWLGGNHEDRWRRLLWGESPVAKLLLQQHQEAAGLGGIDLSDPVRSFSKLFRLDERGIAYYPYGHRLYLANGNLVVTHGKYVSRHSGYSAKRTWEWLGTSCIVGHTHRLGAYLITQDGTPMGAWENGCLCQLEPEYDDAPNWQQGFSVVRVNGPEFHVIQVPIIRRNGQTVAVYHEEGA